MLCTTAKIYPFPGLVNLSAPSGQELRRTLHSARLNYRILYKTNYTTAYQVLASNLLTSSSYSYNLNAIPMQAGEYVTQATKATAGRLIEPSRSTSTHIRRKVIPHPARR